MSAKTADVIVVGAGPAGSAAAIHLARAGLRVLLVEKASFPREKVCGDGLTPRAIRELMHLGVDVEALAWKRIRGLRIHAGARRYQLAWPTLRDFPAFGMTVRRAAFDQYLAAEAVRAGADVLMGTKVLAPYRQRERIRGVTTADGRVFEAPVVVAADGGSARLAVAMGAQRLESRPLGVAVRTYFRSPLAGDDWIDSMLELWEGAPGRSHLLHGYGWSFPLGDGTCNVGLGLPDARRYRDVNLRDLMARWLAHSPKSWGFGEENRTEPLRSAALPMGFNRKPVVRQGLVLVGDAAGLINPFTGEGVSYALESGRLAAEQIIEAAAHGLHSRSADRLIAGYSARLTSAWGGYFRLGLIFTRIFAHPQVMRAAAHYGLPIPVIRTFTHRVLSHLTDHPPGDLYDRVIHLMSALVPKA